MGKIAAVAAGLVVWTAASHAEEVEQTLTGTVTFVGEQIVGTQASLAGLGVTVGAPATVTVRIESTADSEPTSNPDITQYVEPTTSLVLTIGSYEVVQDVPEFFEGLNIIQVGDDGPIGGGGVADTYNLSTPCSDTARLLAGSLGPGSVTTTLSFTDFDGKTGADDGVIQDLAAYPVATAIVGGQGGSIFVTWSTNGGGGPGGPVYDPAKCTKDHLAALGKLGKSILACNAKRAKQPPEKDPLGEKEAACLAKAFAKFDIALAKAAKKAAKKNAACALAELDSVPADEALAARLALLVADVLIAFDANDKHDRVLRGKLLKVAAVQWSKDTSSYAKNALKPNATKLAKSLDKSAAATEKTASKAVEKAAKKGVIYAGPTAGDIADDVRALVEEFVTLAGG